jgi:predicted dehydrogenase
LPDTPTRVAVIGVGAFGRNHLRVYRELESTHPHLVQLVAIVEADAITRDAAAARLNIPAYASVEALLVSPHRPQAASVCVPTVHHAAVAEILLQNGIDVLIEKPFAATLAEADRILALANANKRIVQIGHLERFNPAVAAVLDRLNRPMFFEAHRLSIFTPRSLDVDVVLDLMIHDLDIVLALTNSPVKEVRAVGLPILSRKVDIANVRIELNSGCVANFTASRVSTEQVRKIRLFQPRQYISLDFAKQEILSITVDPAAASPAALAAAAGLSAAAAKNAASGRDDRFAEAAASPAASAPTGSLHDHPSTWSGIRNTAIPHPSAGLIMDKPDLPKAEPLRLELEDFLRAVRERTAPRVTGEAGVAALALALEINQQIASHSKRAGLA